MPPRVLFWRKRKPKKTKEQLPVESPRGLKGWAKFSKRLSVKERDHAEGWRQVLGHRIESHSIQLVVLSLIILDLLVITTEIILDGHYKIGCNPHIPEPVHVAEKALHWASVSILILLAFETVLLLIAFDLEFFTHPMYVLDALVVSASIVFESVFHNSDVGGLLIVLRLWRILRIAHGIALVEEERAHQHVKKVKKQLNKTKIHLEKVKKEKRMLKVELGILQGKSMEYLLREQDKEIEQERKEAEKEEEEEENEGIRNDEMNGHIELEELEHEEEDVDGAAREIERDESEEREVDGADERRMSVGEKKKVKWDKIENMERGLTESID